MTFKIIVELLLVEEFKFFERMASQTEVHENLRLSANRLSVKAAEETDERD